MIITRSLNTTRKISLKLNEIVHIWMQNVNVGALTGRIFQRLEILNRSG